MRFLALALTCAACTPTAFSPPIRMVPLETTEVVRPDRTAIAASFGGHEAGFYSGTARVRQGLIAEHLELQLEGSAMYSSILEDQRPANEWSGGARIGLKHRVVPHVAFTGGVGGGTGPWGSYVGTDLGMIFAYENPYAVPFIALRMQISVPVSVRPEMVPEEMGTLVVSPYTTLYFQPSTGVRIPFCHEDCDVRVALTMAASFTGFYIVPPVDFSWGIFGAEGGVEIEL